MNRKPEEHGTVTGYNQHNNRGDTGDDVCLPCRQALSEYNRLRRTDGLVTSRSRRTKYIFQGDNWTDDAACKGLDADMFYIEQGDAVGARRAKAVCATCPVIDDCLEYALHPRPSVDGQPIYEMGIWAGTNNLDRRRIRQERERALTESISAHPSRGRGAA